VLFAGEFARISRRPNVAGGLFGETLMKKLLAMGLVVLGMLAAGCEGPIPAWQDPNSPLQVSLTGYGLQDKIRVVVPKPERVGAGQLKVTVQVYNTTGSDLTVDYKYQFTDKAGTPVENSNIGWEAERIPPHGYQPIMFTSMSAAAEDFRVQLRPAQ
jgi:uncharacterized protein YcfL